MKRKFSFIVPIYNVEKYLEQCILSMLEQTYLNYEILLINDGSTDLSGEICKKYKDNSKVIYIDKINEGVSVARNVGIEKSSGDWIVFVDPDDWIEKNYLEEINKEIEEDIDIVVFDDWVEFENKQIINKIYKEDKVFMGNEKNDLIMQFFSRNRCDFFPQYHDCSAPWGKAYNKKFLKDKSILFERELYRAQDKIFNLYAFQYARKVKYFSKLLYHYRMNENSTWGRYSPNIIDDLQKLYKHMQIFLDSFDSNNEFKDAFIEKIVLSINSIFRQYYFHEKFEKTKDKRNQINGTLKKEPFNSAINMVSYKKMSFEEKVFVFFIKIRCYEICGFLIWLRRVFLCGR